MKPIPPLVALVAFEAVMRRGGVTTAATDLGLTQSAVSHRLRKLEHFIGVPLLERAAGTVVPTRAGAELADLLPDLLDQLAQLRSRCRSRDRDSVVRVGVGAALANGWLLARLPSFAREQPDLRVELITVDGEAAARTLDLDVQIGWVLFSQARTSPTRKLLFRESVFPVCSPRLLPPGIAQADPTVLQGLPLISKVSRSDTAGAEWSWSTWFDRLALGRVPTAALTVDAIWAALAAAQNGQGVALGRSMLVSDALRDGRLVRVLPVPLDMPSSKVHMVRWVKGACRGRVERVVAWLAAEAAATAGMAA